MSACEESPVKKTRRKPKKCVIHVVKSGNKDETTNFTENPRKGSIKCTFLKKFSYYQKFSECYIGVQLLHQNKVYIKHLAF